MEDILFFEDEGTVINQQLEEWFKNSQDIDWDKTKLQFINVSEKEFNNKIKKFSEENLKSPQIKKIIEALSTE